MHLPAHHAEYRLPLLRQFIRSNPLGLLTTAIRSSVHPLLQTSHIPWLLDVDEDESETEMGKLRGHMARQNPQAKAIIESLTGQANEAVESPVRDPILEEDVLILFNGPVNHYVTPKFYKETKPKTEKVAPTWNYEAVQVYGSAKIYFDTRSQELDKYLSQQLTDLARLTETSIMGYGTSAQPGSRPWQVTDAPTNYITLLKKNIIGIEITIKSMAGRFKMSQEKPKGDREGVIEGFQSLESPAGSAVADIIIKRSAEFDAREAEKQSL